MCAAELSSQYYVTLEAAGGHRVVLPGKAAERSRVLSYLFRGLLAMEIHRQQCWLPPSGSAAAAPAGASETAAGGNSDEGVEDEEEEGIYVSFAPAAQGILGEVGKVVVPLPTLTAESLCRVAQFLTMRNPNGREAIGDMRQDLPEDVRRMSELIRAADLLHC